MHAVADAYTLLVCISDVGKFREYVHTERRLMRLNLEITVKIATRHGMLCAVSSARPIPRSRVLDPPVT